MLFFKSLLSRVSSERNVTQKNAKIFVCILQTFSRNFAFFRENKLNENEANFREKNVRGDFFAKIFLQNAKNSWKP